MNVAHEVHLVVARAANLDHVLLRAVLERRPVLWREAELEDALLLLELVLAVHPSPALMIHMQLHDGLMVALALRGQFVSKLYMVELTALVSGLVLLSELVGVLFGHCPQILQQLFDPVSPAKSSILMRYLLARAERADFDTTTSAQCAGRDVL